MTSLAQTFAEARDHARKGGDHRGEGCGWVGSVAAGLERMIAIQCEAYPASWPEADKREMAEQHLFGRARTINGEPK